MFFFQISLIAWGVANVVFDADGCQESCTNLTTTIQETLDDLATPASKTNEGDQPLVFYDLTGIYISEIPLVSSLFARVLNALQSSTDRADNFKQSNVSLSKRTLNVSSLLCSSLCSLEKPLLLLVAAGTCGGSLIADSFMDGSFLDNSPLTAYLAPALICPVSRFSTYVQRGLLRFVQVLLLIWGILISTLDSPICSDCSNTSRMIEEILGNVDFGDMS